MKESLGFTPEEVIHQNLKVTIWSVMAIVIVIFFIRKYHPVKIAKVYSGLFCFSLPFIPYWLDHTSGLFSLTMLQLAISLPAFCVFGLDTTCYRYVSVSRRFTIIATSFGVVMAIAYPSASLGLIPLTEHFGSYGLWFILVPVIAGFIYGITYLEKLEKKNGRYDYYPDTNDQSDLESLEKAVIDYNFQNPEEYKAHSVQCEYAQGLLNKLRIINQQGKNDVNIRLVEKAIIFAKKWHDGQFRKTGEPYYTHPLAVADIVAEFLPKTDVIVAAILHDVLEDSKCPLELIASEFNERIAQMVYRLTRIRSDENGNEIKLTIEELIDGLKKDDDKEALLIKEVDRLHNLSTIEGLSKEKQDDNANETMKNIVTNVAYTVDDLNINDKLSLENDLLKNCETILKKNDKP